MTHLLRGCGLLVLLLILTVGASAQWLPDQAVTYTNFDYVTAVASSISRTYFATTGGIIVYDKMAGRWEDPLTGADGLLDQVATDLWVDRFDQNLYALTDLGLYHYDDFFQRWTPIIDLPEIDNDTKKRLPPTILLPQFDANYMGEGRFVDLRGRSFSTSAIKQDNSGHLWIGTWGMGPAVADDASGLMELLPYGLLQKRVDFIVPDDTVLWLGGAVVDDFRTGLTALNPEENSFFQLESDRDMGLPPEDIYALAAGKEEIYVGTSIGLYTIERGTWRARGPLDRRSGLADDGITALCLFGDSLFVGTANGLSMISLVSDSVYSVYSRSLGGQTIYDLERVDSTLWIVFSATSITSRRSESAERISRFKTVAEAAEGSTLSASSFMRMIKLSSCPFRVIKNPPFCGS